MRILAVLILLLFFSSARADIAIIGNIENELESMSQKQARDIFMGRVRSLPNGRFVLPLDSLDLRSEFYKLLTGRPIEQINAFWARLIFSGQANPPMKLPNEQDVIKIVTENKGAIGYVESSLADEKLVRVLLILE